MAEYDAAAPRRRRAGRRVGPADGAAVPDGDALPSVAAVPRVAPAGFRLAAGRPMTVHAIMHPHTQN